MQRRSLTNSKKLKWDLWVDAVLNKPPLPYGTFEKAKYVMYRHGTSQPIYWFVTTCRNVEDCIEIMKARFTRITPSKYCSVFKIQNGIRERVFTDKPSWMP